MASSIVVAAPPPPPTSWVESPAAAAAAAAGLLTAGAHPQRSDPTLPVHFSPDFVVQNHPQPVFDDACAPGSQLARNGKGNANSSC